MSLFEKKENDNVNASETVNNEAKPRTTASYMDADPTEDAGIYGTGSEEAAGFTKNTAEAARGSDSKNSAPKASAKKEEAVKEVFAAADVPGKNENEKGNESSGQKAPAAKDSGSQAAEDKAGNKNGQAAAGSESAKKPDGAADQKKAADGNAAAAATVATEAAGTEKKEDKVIEDTKAKKKEKKAGKKSGGTDLASQKKAAGQDDGGKIVKGLAIALGVAVVGIYALGVYHSNSHFEANTVINGYDVSDMTASDVENAINQRIGESTITLAFRGGSTETIKGTDFDYGYYPDGQVESLLQAQNPWLWFTSFFTHKNYQITTPINYSNDKLEALLYQMPEMQFQNMTAPTDAYVTYGTDSFVVAAETYGSELNRQTFVLDLIDYLDHSGGNSQVVDVSSLYNAYVDPQVYQDNEGLHEQADELQQLCGAKITYDLPDGSTEVLDGDTLRTWLSQDENGSYYKDETVWEDNLDQYVEDFAERHDTNGQVREFNSTNHGVVTIDSSRSTFGNVIDVDDEEDELAGELATHTITEREPKMSCREAADGGIGNTYVEADLTNQHVYVYIDGKMTMDSDCVSGMMTSSRMTPEGVFYINNMSRNTNLVGADYVSFVNYWMSFYGSGYGLHDATWRGSFGGSIYRGSGSHGCINLPKSFASELYDVAYVGMPVVVFYAD